MSKENSRDLGQIMINQIRHQKNVNKGNGLNDQILGAIIGEV